MDVVLHPLQRRLGCADTGWFLCTYRLERMAELGVPAGCGGNELDSYLCNELDDERFHRRLPRPASRWHIRSGWSDFSASAPWFRGVSGFLVHPVLDVPKTDFLEDMTESQIVRRRTASLYLVTIMHNGERVGAVAQVTKFANISRAGGVSPSYVRKAQARSEEGFLPTSFEGLSVGALTRKISRQFSWLSVNPRCSFQYAGIRHGLATRSRLNLGNARHFSRGLTTPKNSESVRDSTSAG